MMAARQAQDNLIIYIYNISSATSICGAFTYQTIISSGAFEQSRRRLNFIVTGIMGSADEKWQTRPSRVLILTNSELGQANVVLAFIQGLLEQDPSVDIHVSSFPQLKPALDSTTAFISSALATSKPSITFHPLPGRPMFAAMGTDQPDPKKNWFVNADLPPGPRNTPVFMRMFLRYLWFCWESSEAAAIIQSLCTSIESLTPDVVVVDSLFAPGLTAATHVNSHNTNPRTKYPTVVISPNSLKDFVGASQPKFWRWPTVGTALPAPLPWWLIPLNLYYLVRLIWLLVTDPVTPSKTREIQELTGLGDRLQVVRGSDIIVQNLKQVDKLLLAFHESIEFPELETKAIPEGWKKMLTCGPMLRPAPPVEETDPELAAWLARGEVVYIGLGTHIALTKGEAVDMALAMRRLFDAAPAAGRPDLRLLWKLRRKEGKGKDSAEETMKGIQSILGPEIDADRVRIVEWVRADPSAVLASGRVVTFVNHGGANSYCEAVV